MKRQNGLLNQIFDFVNFKRNFKEITIAPLILRQLKPYHARKLRDCRLTDVVESVLRKNNKTCVKYNGLALWLHAAIP